MKVAVGNGKVISADEYGTYPVRGEGGGFLLERQMIALGFRIEERELENPYPASVAPIAQGEGERHEGTRRMGQGHGSKTMKWLKHTLKCGWSGFSYYFIFNDGKTALLECRNCGYRWEW